MGSYSNQKGKIWVCWDDLGFRWEVDINRRKAHSKKVNSFSVVSLF